MKELKYTCTYLNDLLCMSKNYFDGYLKEVEKRVLKRKEVHLKVNVSNLTFCKNDIYYLEYVVTREDIKVQHKNIEKILKAARSIYIKDGYIFLGMKQYYSDT